MTTADDPVKASDSDGPALDRERHLRYFLRCLRTLLPRQYTSNDSTRMALAFFILSGIDLLTLPAIDGGNTNDTKSKPPVITRAERQRFRDWILSCQHSGGGFCGSTSHTLPEHEYDGWNFTSWSPEPGNPGCANIAATAFALLLLAVIAEDESAESAYYGVDRVATLRWLKQLQRPDGSFGEVLVEMPAEKQEQPSRPQVDRKIAGGRDMRYCYLASIIRWILRGDVQEGHPAWVPDIDVGALISHICASQTFDGGAAESSMHESHAGYAYCAISAIYLLDRPLDSSSARTDAAIGKHGVHVPSMIHFLASRKFAYQDPDTSDGDSEGDESENFPQPPSLSRLYISNTGPAHAGFNGRFNKVADTCYCWWVCGTLEILKELDGDNLTVAMTDDSARRFLMEKTQHIVGGFSKHPGGHPDVYHAYFGLSALAVLGEPGLRTFDVGLCISQAAVARVLRARKTLLNASKASAHKPRDDSNLDRCSAQALLRIGEALSGSEIRDLVCSLSQPSTKSLLEEIVGKRRDNASQPT